jgi:hypothetical protein
MAWRSVRAGRSNRWRQRRGCRCPINLGSKQDYLPLSFPHLLFPSHRSFGFSRSVTHDSRSGFLFKAIRIDAAIDHPFIVNDIVGNVYCVVDQGHIAGWRHNDPLQTGIEKLRSRDKTPGIPTGAKVLTRRGKANARLKLCCGRQRRPPDETASATPTHPGGPPLRTGNPSPATVVLVVEPASIMEGYRTPRLGGNPGPAKIIGEHPVA